MEAYVIFSRTRFNRYEEMAGFIYRIHERERISVAEAQQASCERRMPLKVCIIE